MKGYESIRNIHVSITSVYEGEIMGNVGIGWEEGKHRFHFWLDPNTPLETEAIFANDFAIYKNDIDIKSLRHARQLDPRAHANQGKVLHVIAYVREHKLIEKARQAEIDRQWAEKKGAYDRRLAALRSVASTFNHPYPVIASLSDEQLIALTDALMDASIRANQR